MITPDQMATECRTEEFQHAALNVQYFRFMLGDVAPEHEGFLKCQQTIIKAENALIDIAAKKMQVSAITARSLGHRHELLKVLLECAATGMAPDAVSIMPNER